MPDHLFFYLTFFAQVVVISYYFGGKLHKWMKYVLETYPPESHPKLYPRPVEHYQRSARFFNRMNQVILVVGLAVLTVLITNSWRESPPHSTMAIWFFFIQLAPMFYMDISTSQKLKLMREMNRESTRKALLRPRRLFDFIPPIYLVSAGLTYLAFAVLVLYVRRDPFPGFAGAGNIIAVGIMNLFFGCICYWHIYGKKQNPYQSHEDRMTQNKLIIHTMVFVSIAATVFVGIHIVLSAIEMRHLQAPLRCIYFILVAGLGLQAHRIDYTNFEVYREERA